MVTYFRAFQLNSKGSLFSFWKNNVYTLIEARLPKDGIDILTADVRQFSKDKIDKLHITSWDTDHCNVDDLTQILNHFRPDSIEIPGYEPDSETARSCKRLIKKYDYIHQKYVYNVTTYDKATIDNLPGAQAWGTANIVYHSQYNVENHNDMSQIRLFRSEGFNVLSLGDCESEEITDALMRDYRFLRNEVDILILPHHGSDHSMLTGEFLDFCKPSIAVCSSNYDNEHDHPHQPVRNLLSRRDIKLMTTKRGDVIVFQEDSVQKVKAHNLAANNEKVEEIVPLYSKRQRR
jgi:competence protein ComEC